ncbi:MAG: hypothetical protein ACERLM_05205, partial [Acidimicrobiales bacterium]
MKVAVLMGSPNDREKMAAAAETLEKFGKAHGVEAIDLCIENLHKHNIGIHGMFVMGMDDDAESVRKIV